MWIAMAAPVCVFGQVSVLTWHNDNFRTGQNLQETALTPANVNSSTFGKLFTIAADGKVDAEPLYVPSLVIPNKGTHNVLFVVTEHDSVYAVDADTGTQLWQVSLLASGESTSDARGCDQVVPEIGITSTPVIDPQMGPHGTMYVVAMSLNGTTYHHRLHALDLTTGAEEFNGPIEVQATYPGNGANSVGGSVIFDPKQYKERAGLLLSNGTVYTSWTSHCDAYPYTAWVIGYNESNLSRVSILNLTPNGSEGSVWGAGAGPAVDASGNIFLLMANGTFDTTLTNGFPAKGDYGNAFVKVAAGATSVADYFTMSNTVSESGGDIDLGSGGAMLLPTLNDAQGKPHDLAVGAGKDGNIYVVDRANMGKYNPGTNSIYQEFPSAVGGVYSSPAWFNGTLYYGAVDDTLKAFAFSAGKFGASPASQSALSFAYPGTTPSVSANGISNGIVWAAENNGTAVLHAYNAGNLATELYNSNQAANGRDHFGAGNKFIVPMVVNGKVYVGTTNGVGVFGLLCGPASVPLPANSAAGVTLNATLNWTAGAGATSYDVYFGVTATPPFVGNTTGTSYNPGTLSPGKTYYWRIVSKNCASTTSPTWSFTTQPLAAGTPTKIGILRAGMFMTAEDVNGNIAWDPGIDHAFFFGIPGDILIHGDWDGSGKTKLGIFRPGSAMFALDMNGNGVWDPGIDKFGFFGAAGDMPIVGDWTGDGKSKIGIYRPSTTLFALDIKNNLAYDVGTDKIGHFGNLGDVPIVGDWTGDGITKIGIYRPLTQQFAEDVNNNLAWDSGIDKQGVFGVAGDTPIVGDWTGNGIAKIGIYRRSTSLWELDLNNNLTWDAGTDKSGVFGAPGDLWVVGDWDGTGVARAGVFRPSVGLWGLDKNGNLAWDAGVDLSGVFGAAGDTPVVGKW
jgi:hypothetical protein